MMRMSFVSFVLLSACTVEYDLKPEVWGLGTESLEEDVPTTTPALPDEEEETPVGAEKDPEPEYDEPLSEILVAFLIGHQCISQNGGGNGVKIEVAGVQAILDELGVTQVDLYEEGEDGLDPATDLTGYDAAIFTRCGWQWQRDNGPAIAMLAEARAAGVGVLFFGDDSAYGMNNLPDTALASALIGLEPAGQNGSSTDIVLVDSALDAFLDDAFETPTTLRYEWDVDVTELAEEREGVEANVLATRGTSSAPVWVTQRWDDGGDTVTLLASVAEANHGPPGDAHAMEQLRLIFAHSLSWVALK